MPLKLRPKPLKLSKETYAGEDPQQNRNSDPMPVSLTILSGSDLYNFVPDRDGWCEYRRFVFDIETLKFNERMILDWNHDPDEVIGSLETIKAENGTLKADGFIVPFKEDDRASEVAYKARFIPFGVSPLVSFDEAEAVYVEEGETIEANGQVYEGDIVLFRNARILGAAICPYPTDEMTSVTALGKNDGILTKQEEEVMSIFKFASDDDEKKKKKCAADQNDDSEKTASEPEGNGGSDGGGGDSEPSPGGGEPEPQSNSNSGGTQENAKADQNSVILDKIAEVSESLKALSKVVAEAEKCREEALSKLVAAAQTIHGAEPVGFSGSGRSEMSYADAVNKQLDKISQR